MAELKPGGRLASAVCTTEVIVVKAPVGEVDVCCGGAAMIEPGGDTGGDVDPAAAEGTLLGKRYVNEDESLELLCTKAGDGSIAVSEALLVLKEAKPLPASD
jgi:hypothetical protein